MPNPNPNPSPSPNPNPNPTPNPNPDLNLNPNPNPNPEQADCSFEDDLADDGTGGVELQINDAEALTSTVSP